jgi:hypothetical protein
MKPELLKAKRWARRVGGEQSKADKNRCVRRTLDALYSILPPKRDGTHPLDPEKMKLEGD